MTKKDKTTGNGGNRGYSMTRSKIAKGPDGYGKVITVAREKMLRRLGYDPGYNKVAMHASGGSHHEKDGGKVKKMGTRAENTAESNRARAKKKRK